MTKTVEFFYDFGSPTVYLAATQLPAVADQAGDSEALVEISKRLGLYMLTVIFALVIHSMIILPLLLKYFGKINPLSHVKAMSIPLLTAFSTSSSSATLPLTMEAIEKKAGVST